RGAGIIPAPEAGTYPRMSVPAGGESWVVPRARARPNGTGFFRARRCLRRMSHVQTSRYATELPKNGGGRAPLLATERHLPQERGAAAGGQDLRLLRGAADGQRPAGRAPRDHARLQGPVSALQ